MTDTVDTGVSALELNRTVFEVLDDYGPGSVISTGRVNHRIRNLLPELAMGDFELSNLVAQHALSTGHSIVFDERRQV